MAMQENNFDAGNWAERAMFLPQVLHAATDGKKELCSDDGLLCRGANSTTVTSFVADVPLTQATSYGSDSVPSLRRLERSFKLLLHDFEQLPSRKKLSCVETSERTSKELPVIHDIVRKSSSVTPPERSQVAAQNGGRPRVVMAASKLTPRTNVSSSRLFTSDSRVLSSPSMVAANNTPTRRRPTEKALGPAVDTLKLETPRGRTRGGCIRVVVRKRPLGSGESGCDCVTVDPPNVHVAVKKVRFDLTDYEDVNDFTFDDAFSEEKKNVHVFESCGKELISTVLKGGSASCFAYGQTGSGKTHTMLGNEEEKGLYVLAATELFARLPTDCEVYAALYEIYCNSLFDLLNNRAPIIVREDHSRRVNLCGLSWNKVDSADALWRLISSGAVQRSTGSTSANEHSSRSHAVLTIRLSSRDDPSFCGTLNLVDLAGSERASDTATKDRQTRKEGSEINKSLLALKECIRALDEKKKHVPFRGSKLTEVLRDSFVGSSCTVMIANISASSCNYEHTVGTLRYAFRVKGLSVASVEPSKARNAPRPFRQPITGTPRQRSCSGARIASSHAQRQRTPRNTANSRRACALSRGGSTDRRSFTDRSAMLLPFVRNTSLSIVDGNSNDNDSSSSTVFSSEDVFIRYFRSLTREKVVGLLSLRDSSQGSGEDASFGANGGAKVGDCTISLEEQQKLTAFLEYVAGQMRRELRSETARLIKSRDLTIRRLRNENSALQASVAMLKKKAEECPACRSKSRLVKELGVL